MKTLIIFFGLLYSTLLPAMEVACGPPETNFNEADVVFVGTVTKKVAVEKKKANSRCWSQEQGPKCGAKIVTVKMEQSLKGEFHDNITVSADDACYCVSPYLEEGMKYIIFAKKTESNLVYTSMNACATVPYDQRHAEQLSNYQKER